MSRTLILYILCTSIIGTLVTIISADPSSRDVYGPEGVCEETREQEVLHNRTVYYPCIRRFVEPCGRSYPHGRSVCTVYRQTTCTDVYSRSEMRNITSHVCCDGWQQDAFGICVRVTPLPTTPVTTPTTPTKASTVHVSTLTTTRATPRRDSGLLSTLSVTFGTSPTVVVTELGRSSHPPHTDTKTLGGSNVALDPDPILDPPQPSTPTQATLTVQSTTTTQTTPPYKVTKFVRTTKSPPTYKTSLKTTKSTLRMIEGKKGGKRPASPITPPNTTPIESIAETLLTSSTDVTAANSTHPRSTLRWIYRDIPQKTHQNETESDGGKDSVTKTTSPKHTLTVRSGNDNRSIAIVTSGGGRHGMNNLIYIGVVIAIIIIVMTVMCGVYVFFFKDKPRRNNTLNTVPPEVHLNNCYMNGSLYETDDTAEADLDIEHDTSMEIPEETFTSSTFTVSNGNVVIPLPYSTSRSIQDEPPLTTSTPIIRSADRYGFAYENPSFRIGDERQSSSDEDVSQSEPSKSTPSRAPPGGTKTDDGDGANGGYMIPVLKPDLPPTCSPVLTGHVTVEGTSLPPIPETPEPEDAPEPPPSPISACIGDNIENELRGNGDVTTSNNDGYERIPADRGPSLVEVEGPQDPPSADSTLTNGTHTYEEIPADLLLSPGGVLTDNPSGDLPEFTPNPWASPVGAEDDPNATYDKADMFTPATPPAPRDTARPSNIGGALVTPDCTQVTYDVPNEVKKTPPKIPTRRFPDVIPPDKGPQKSCLRNKDPPKVVANAIQTDDKSCSFENIYETVKCEALLLDRTPKSKRRHILHSPVLPVKELEFSVIDLSDEEETSPEFNCKPDGTKGGNAGPKQPANSQLTLTLNGVDQQPVETETQNLDKSDQEPLAGSSRDYGESHA